MTGQFLEHLVWDGADVGAEQGGLRDVARVADGGDENFGIEVVVLPDSHDVLNEIHPLLSGVVEPADEWADDIRSCFCR